MLATLLLLLCLEAARVNSDFVDVNLRTINKVISNGTGTSNACLEGFRRFYEKNLTIHKSWSDFNHIAKFGNSHDFGDFLACKGFSTVEMSTQYCLIQYFDDENAAVAIPPARSFFQNKFSDLDVTFLGAVCLPTFCSQFDVEEILKLTIFGRNLSKFYCKRDLADKFVDVEDPVLNWLNFERLLILASIALLTISLKFTNIPRLQLSNIVKDLFSVNSKTSSTAYINAIKAVTTVIIVLFHSWHCRAAFPFKNGENCKSFSEDFFYLIFYFFLTTMDVFFIVGGWLSAMSLRRECKNGKNFKWFAKFYVRRLFRLLPVTILVLLFILTTKAENSAPYSFDVNPQICIDDNNSYFSTYRCLILTVPYFRYAWFIVVYFQLTILAPFAFLAMNSKIFGKFAIFLVLFLSAVCRFSLTSFGYFHDYYGKLNAKYIMDSKLHNIYISLGNRFLPFFIGMAFEKLLLLKKFETKYQATAFIFFAVNDLAFLMSGIFNIPSTSSLLDVNYVASWLWLFYFCHHNDGIIKKILTSSFWSPIAKMGFSIYMIFAYLQFSIQERQLEPLQVNNGLHFLLLFLNDIACYILPTFLVFVLVEEPLSRIGDLLSQKL